MGFQGAVTGGCRFRIVEGMFGMGGLRRRRLLGSWAVMLAGLAPVAGAMQHVTLRSGFAVDCERREVVGDRVRLYFAGQGPGAADYMEVAADAVASEETVPDPVVGKSAAAQAPVPRLAVRAGGADLSAAEMGEMLARAGTAHHIDADLLASVVRAESGGRVTAVSRTGARGLMQLMPGTATELGVRDAFAPEENIRGGTAYLDALLTRYHDNAALALAAYNAGPRAVERWGGVPPYRETRAYVARVIREFNRRKVLAAGVVR